MNPQALARSAVKSSRQLAGRIAAKVLQVSRARYQTPECRNVAAGHALLALGEFFDLLRKPAPVIRFARAQLKNPRAATRNKAERFLRRLPAKA